MQVSGLAVQDTEMQNVDGGIQGLKKKLEAGDDEEKTEKVSCEIIHPLRVADTGINFWWGAFPYLRWGATTTERLVAEHCGE